MLATSIAARRLYGKTDDDDRNGVYNDDATMVEGDNPVSRLVASFC